MQQLKESKPEDIMEPLLSLCLGNNHNAYENWNECLQGLLNVLIMPIKLAITSAVSLAIGVTLLPIGFVTALSDYGNVHVLGIGLTLILKGLWAGIAACVAPFGLAINFLERALSTKESAPKISNDLRI